MRKTVLTAALLAAGIAGINMASADSIPGMRGHDHSGITVPDMKQAVEFFTEVVGCKKAICLLYTSPSPRDGLLSRMPSSA